jgi:hypothetical protein
MKLLILLAMICSSGGIFNGCPLDGCERTLSGFVDIHVDGFDKDVEWRRTDLLNNTSRGCVSNGLYSLMCAVDMGYISINVTNGHLLWSIPLEIEEKTVAASLPIINYQGYSLIANGTRCTYIDPDGAILGTFNYEPKLIPPLAGPFVTDEGQIIVADLTSVSYEHIKYCSKMLNKTEHKTIELSSTNKPLRYPKKLSLKTNLVLNTPTNSFSRMV